MRISAQNIVMARHSPTSQLQDDGVRLNNISDTVDILLQNPLLRLKQIVRLRMSDLLEELETLCIPHEQGGKPARVRSQTQSEQGDELTVNLALVTLNNGFGSHGESCFFTKYTLDK